MAGKRDPPRRQVVADPAPMADQSRLEEAGPAPHHRGRHRARPRPLRDDAVMDMTTTAPDVLIIKEGLAGRLRLNRPRARHSLNRQMGRDMARALIEWRDDPDVRIILIDHAEGRGFCAGGDVVDISLSVEGQDAAARAFFFDEYR